MKIFQIVDSKNFGGIETHILELCLLLKSKKLNIKVIFISKYKENKLRDKLIENNIDYEEETLYYNINNNNGDIFHSHGYKANIYNKSLKILFNHKIICSYHSGEKHKGKMFLYELLDKKSALISDKNIAVSNLIKNQILTNNVDVSYNFIFKDSHFKPNCDFKNVSFVGRLSEEKNPEDFIEISNLNKDLNFNIFGDGDLKSLINKKDNIKFCGYTDDQNEIWDNTDILLITSKYEGLPYVLIEAMSRGIIIISYRVGEIPNIIKNGKNGFLANDISDVNKILKYLEKMNKKDKNKIKMHSLETFEKLFGKTGGHIFLNNYASFMKKNEIFV